MLDRPAIQQMKNDARNGQFDVVVFTAVSRLSRNALDAKILKTQLVDMCKIRLVSVEERFDSEKDDDFFWDLYFMMAQKRSEEISVSSRRGIEKSAQRGNFTASFAPYGYKKAVIGGRKTLVIDEEAAEVVRLIFNLYVSEKMGEKKIVDYLNSPEVGIPSPKKRGAWGITTVQKILQNEAYAGSNVFSKYTNVVHFNDMENVQDRSKKLVQRNKKDWLRTVEKTHEPIIDDSLFQRAQEIRRIRGGGCRGGHRKPVNVFAKIIFCKHCGSAMVTMSSKVSNGKRYYYLICSRRRREGVAGCENGKWIPYQEMRDELIGWVERRIREQLDVEAGTDDVINHIKEHENPAKSTENEIKKIKKQIEQNRELMFKLRRQNMIGDLDDAQFKYEKGIYEKEIAELESKLEKMQEVVARQKDYEEDRAKIKAAVNELTNLDTYDEVEKVRVTLSKLITEIIVDNDGNIDVYTLLGKLA